MKYSSLSLSALFFLAGCSPKPYTPAPVPQKKSPVVQVSLQDKPKSRIPMALNDQRMLDINCYDVPDVNGLIRAFTGRYPLILEDANKAIDYDSDFKKNMEALKKCYLIRYDFPVAGIKDISTTPVALYIFSKQALSQRQILDLPAVAYFQIDRTHALPAGRNGLNTLNSKGIYIVAKYDDIHLPRALRASGQTNTDITAMKDAFLYGKGHKIRDIPFRWHKIFTAGQKPALDYDSRPGP